MTVTQVYGKIPPTVESDGRTGLSTIRAGAGEGGRTVGSVGAMLIVTCALLALIPSGPGDWRWPLPPVPRVVRDYDPPPRPWLRGHRGVDLAARPGQPVYAAGAGRVGYAGRLAGRGVVAVVHGPLRTSYLPV